MDGTRRVVYRTRNLDYLKHNNTRLREAVGNFAPLCFAAGRGRSRGDRSATRSVSLRFPRASLASAGQRTRRVRRRGMREIVAKASGMYEITHGASNVLGYDSRTLPQSDDSISLVKMASSNNDRASSIDLSRSSTRFLGEKPETGETRNGDMIDGNLGSEA